MGYQKAVLLSRLVFFRCHSRNGWRKSAAPWFPIGLLTELHHADSVPLSNTNPGVCWSLLCARVLQTRKSIFEREIRAWILRDQTSSTVIPVTRRPVWLGWGFRSCCVVGRDEGN
uniref:Uncharacterized protein n=1 Tax=Pristionchus pacificus TaxID=54126 RepID=A0A8R1YS34_PRIPA